MRDRPVESRASSLREPVVIVSNYNIGPTQLPPSTPPTVGDRDPGLHTQRKEVRSQPTFWAATVAALKIASSV
jgi:hypothetical protein